MKKRNLDDVLNDAIQCIMFACVRCSYNSNKRKNCQGALIKELQDYIWNKEEEDEQTDDGNC